MPDDADFSAQCMSSFSLAAETSALCGQGR